MRLLLYDMPVIQQKKRVTQLIKRPKPEKIQRVLTLREFYEARNKVLVFRNTGGLGDIFMHRMMFEDFHRVMPDVEVHFACPPQYFPAVVDHPYVAKVVNSFEVQRRDYIVHYNTTTACGRYEMKMAPFSGLHRADIWAEQCGLILSNHNMHIRLTDEEKQRGKNLIEQHRDRPGPAVCIAPVSAMENKNLLPHQLMGVVEGLRERGCYVFGLHNHPLYTLIKNKVPSISGTSIRDWMGILNQTDYVISVDTAAFHCAGGMGKPLVGIFTFADGKVYGKYFDFFLVQRHRDDDPCWNCGPCYNWGNCPKTKSNPKPCLTEITPEMILEKADMMLKKWPMV